MEAVTGMGTARWDDYYANATLHSSTGGFSADARLRIEAQWTDVFESLAAGSQVLDVGSGSGALLALAAATAREDHALELTGVDQALVRSEVTPRSARYCAIRYQGGVDALELPFGDRVFDLVCSQYGLEYAGLDAALQEAGRVSADRLAALVHAAEGVVVRQNGPIADQIDWLLDELGLIAALGDHLEAASEATGSRLKGIARAMGEASRRLENPTFLKGLAGHVGEFLMHAHDQTTDRLAAFERHLRGHAERMRALVASAQDPSRLDRAMLALKQARFRQASWTPLRSDQDRHLVGYWISARR